jgi:hypothetical protein
LEWLELEIEAAGSRDPAVSHGLPPESVYSLRMSYRLKLRHEDGNG